MVEVTETNRNPDVDAEVINAASVSADSGTVGTLEATDASVSNAPLADEDVARKLEVDAAGKSDSEIAKIAYATDFRRPSETIRDNPIGQTIQEGNTLEVPSGESWFVRISTTPNSGVIRMAYRNSASDLIFGDKLIEDVNEQESTVELVIHEGFIIEAKSSNALVTGHKISTEINNSTVAITLSEGESTTVPAGKSWRVSIGTRSKNDGRTHVSYDTPSFDDMLVRGVTKTLPFENVTLHGGATIKADNYSTLITGYEL